MFRNAQVLLLAAAPLIAGCSIEGAPPAPRNDEEVFSRSSLGGDPREPGGLFTVKPAALNRVKCPHCGAVNTLGQKDCTACGKRISLRPLRTPCAACEGRGKTELGQRCAACEGAGWSEAQEK